MFIEDEMSKTLAEKDRVYQIVIPKVMVEGKPHYEVVCPKVCPVSLRPCSEGALERDFSSYLMDTALFKKSKTKADAEFMVYTDSPERLKDGLVHWLQDGCLYLYITNRKYAEKVMEANDDANCYILPRSKFQTMLLRRNLEKTISLCLLFGLGIPLGISILMML